MVTIPRAVPVQHLNASRDKHRLSAVLARLWPESGAVSPLPALDGLRALAVLLVLLFHAWGEKNDWHNPLNYGRTGVHLFFVLSGFLLFVPYARYLFGLQQRPHTLRFYQRRILRVGPAYWISLGILSIVGVFPVFGLKDVLVHASYLFNAWPQSIYSINSVYWTMAIEVQFYAVLPLIGWITYALAHRAGPTLAAVIIVTGLFLISLGNNELKHLAHVSHLFVSPLLVGETSMPFWLGVFGAGIACAIVYVYLMEVAHLTVDAVKTLRTSSSVILAVGVAIGLVVAFTPRAATLPNKNVLFGLIYAALLVGILFGWPILRRPFTWGGDAVHRVNLLQCLYLASCRHALDSSLPFGPTLDGTTRYGTPLDGVALGASHGRRSRFGRVRAGSPPLCATRVPIVPVDGAAVLSGTQEGT